MKTYYHNRFELKYVLDLNTYYKILKDIEVLFKKDPLGDKNAEYKVISLYYDTSGLKFFWEKLDGEEQRVKLRLRTYVHKRQNKGQKKSRSKDKSKKGHSDVFIELKKKNNKNVSKKRVLLSEDQAKEFLKSPSFDKTFIKKLDERGKKALSEAAYLKCKFMLEPTLIISYKRKAFVSKDNLNVRVTFDSNIRYRNKDFSLETKEGDGQVLPSNLVIMEIKYTDYFPLWLVQLIQKYDCGLQAFSKYCNGIESLFCEKPILGEINGMVH